jgi:hypothetical protein
MVWCALLETAQAASRLGSPNKGVSSFCNNHGRAVTLLIIEYAAVSAAKRELSATEAGLDPGGANISFHWLDRLGIRDTSD